MPSTTKIVARYAETDQMGIVHHSVYPIWYEVARTDYIKECGGMSYSYMESVGVMMPLLDVYSRFILPAKYEDSLIVKAKIKNLAISNIEFEYNVYREDKLINTGTTRHAFVDTKTFRPLNLKKRFPEIFQKLEEEFKKCI